MSQDLLDDLRHAVVMCNEHPEGNGARCQVKAAGKISRTDDLVSPGVTLDPRVVWSDYAVFLLALSRFFSVAFLCFPL